MIDSDNQSSGLKEVSKEFLEGEKEKMNSVIVAKKYEEQLLKHDEVALDQVFDAPHAVKEVLIKQFGLEQS